VSRARKADPLVLAVFLILIVVGVLALSGCAPAVVQTREVEVKVPIIQRCVFPAFEKPQWSMDKVDPKGPRILIVGGRAALSELDQREAYIQQLEAAIEACRK
jgi:hypothetical protein